MKTANDDNEGKLGVLRVGSRRAQNMSLHQRNARNMYKDNDTKTYIKTFLTKPADHRYLRQKAREVDSSQLEQKRRQKQAVADKEVVESKRKKDMVRMAAKQKVNDELDKVVCRLDISIIKSSPGTNASLDLEIGWFRRLDNEVPIKARLGNKELKVQALIQAVERHLIRIAKAAKQLGSPDSELTLDLNDYTASNDSDVDSDADMELNY